MRANQLAFSFRVLLALILVSPWAAGCAIGSEDIERWKQTQKGPEKILRVLTSERYPIALRAEAAFAMVEIDRSDLAGLHELGAALDKLAVSEPETTEAIVRDLAPRLEAMMKGDADEPPTAEQIRAKDAAFALVAYAEGPVEEKLVDEIVAFYVADFSARSLAGDVSAEQVAKRLGDPAVSRMVGAMEAKMPPEALVKLAELVARHGSDATKARAAERLVAIEREMGEKEYGGWLESQIRDQQGEDIDDARLAAMVSLNREKFVNQGALAAMKHLSGEEKVAARLVAIASEGPAEDAPELVVELMDDRRKTALVALEGSATKEHLEALLALALEGAESLELRDLAFDRIAETKSTTAISSLWPLVQTSSNEELDKRLRWRAGELVLSLGGPGVVEELLRRLPAGRGVEYEPSELGGYAARIAEMSEPPTTTMRAAVKGGPWFRNVIAARYLAERGEASDAELLAGIAGSRVALVGQGWDRLDPPQKTVGDAAKAASEQLEKRLAEDSDEPVEGS